MRILFALILLAIASPASAFYFSYGGTEIAYPAAGAAPYWQRHDNDN